MGRFTEVAGPMLAGLDIFKQGTKTILNWIKEKGMLVHEHTYTHSYPYDWRSKQPVILR
jgi:isoleucyl-tRNA synthetase